MRELKGKQCKRKFNTITHTAHQLFSAGHPAYACWLIKRSLSSVLPGEGGLSGAVASTESRGREKEEERGGEGKREK